MHRRGVAKKRPDVQPFGRLFFISGSMFVHVKLADGAPVPVLTLN